MVLCSSGGFKSLIDEVEMDIKRLSRRNLGRDDRFVLNSKMTTQHTLYVSQVHSRPPQRGSVSISG